MRNRVLFSLVVAIWLAAGQPAPAAGAEPIREPALTLTLSQRERGRPVEFRSLPQNRLEERLFADAADGRLDEFSPLEAALVAGGVEDADTLHRYQQKAAALVDQLRRSAALDGTPAQRAEAIFEFMHRHVLRGGYDLAYTDLRRVLDEGRFNCVSATVLFNYLAGEFGLECRGLEMPGHAMSRVVLPDGTLDIETTCPRWFRLTGDPKLQEAAATKMIGAAAVGRSLEGPRGLADPNGGDDLLQPGRRSAGGKAFCRSGRGQRQGPAARSAKRHRPGNLLATINNWSIELGNSQHFAEAVDLLRQGLAIDAKFEAFAQNYVHVHHQWVDHLCRAGRFEEAIDILSRAAAEMPDRDYLRRAQSEVCQRWAQAGRRPDDPANCSCTCLAKIRPCRWSQPSPGRKSRLRKSAAQTSPGQRSAPDRHYHRGEPSSGKLNRSILLLHQRLATRSRGDEIMPGPGRYWIGEEERREVKDVLDSGYVFRYGDLNDPKFTHKVYTLGAGVRQVLRREARLGHQLRHQRPGGLGAGDGTEAGRRSDRARLYVRGLVHVVDLCRGRARAGRDRREPDARPQGHRAPHHAARPRPSCRSTCWAIPATWTPSWRSPRSAGCWCWKTPARPPADRTTAASWAPSAGWAASR